MSLFLFGPLADPSCFRAVTGLPLEGRVARLPGYVLTGAAQADPAPAPRAGGAVTGVLVPRPEGAAAARLAAYGAAFGHESARVEVVSQEETQLAEARFAAPGAGAPDWDEAGFRAALAGRWALMAGEIAAHAPPLDPQGFARQRKMIETRAAARLRAGLEEAPATLRRAAAPGDVEWRHDAPLAGQFFKLDTMRLSHRRFDGGMARELPREVLVGVDAALVLPYDPRRDRLLLVEQFRSGPARRGAANAWSLEPVAGIVDPGETPAEAALREAREEAGLEIARLIPIFEGYPSPGSSTDHFHCFLGLADLPREESWRGGLAEEHEDLRLHAIGFDRAMALAGAGEIDVIPMQAMLYWLAHHRARLRAEAGMRDA